MKNLLFISAIFLMFSSLELRAQETDYSIEVPDSLYTNFMQKKLEFNKSHSEAFCIQLYSGNEARAKDKSEAFKEIFPDAEVRLVFDSPLWKTQTGIYLDKRSAELVLKELKKGNSRFFIEALVVPHQFKY